SSTSTKVPRNSAIISPPRFWRIRTQRPGWRACDRVELIAGLPVLRKSCESVLRGAALVACPLTVGSRGAGNNTIRSTLSYGGYGAGMPGTVQAVERAAAILRLLAVRGTPLALGEIAAALGLAKTTAHGLLRTLLEVDFVSQEPGSGRYVLGDTLRHLGAGSVDVNELRSKSMNWADTLASRSGEAVRLATSGDDGVVVIHHVFRPDDTVQRLDTGAVLPAHATALGKLLVAHDDTLAATVRAADRPAFTRRTVTASVELDRELAGVREAGWIAEIGQFRPG